MIDQIALRKETDGKPELEPSCVVSEKQLAQEEIYVFLRQYLEFAEILFDAEGKLILSPKRGVEVDRKVLEKVHYLYGILRNYSKEIRGYLDGREPSPWIRLLAGLKINDRGKQQLLPSREVAMYEYTVNAFFGGIYGFWNFVVEQQNIFKGVSFYFGGTFWAVPDNENGNKLVKCLDPSDPVYAFSHDRIELVKHP